MLGRLILGILKGAIIGGIVAAVLVKGLGVTTFGAVLAYVVAVVTGVLTGLLAGKPFWKHGAKIESGLRAGFGALLAAGAMYAIRTWLPFNLDLSQFQAGAGAIGELPAASIPLISAALAMLFDVDNTPGGDDEEETKDKKRVAGEKKRIADADSMGVEELDETEEAPRKMRR